MAATPPVFTLQDLRKTYGSGESAVHALRGVSLTVAAGELIVLLGPSGSGKSTLLNILGGLDRPTAGLACFETLDLGTAPDELVTDYRRRNVGFVFQFYNLIASLTAQENVELVTEVAPSPMDAASALDLVGLGERRRHFPAQLSGGEQQRVAIARAIAKRPAVLLCDEPTGALDVATGVRVLEAIVRANGELRTTTLVITHNADIARIGDRVVRFADGLIRSVEDNAVRVAPAELHLVIRLRTLDRKLLRDLVRMRMQAFAVSGVLACGVALFVMATGMYGSLARARDHYYDSARMADLAASVVRAPDTMAPALARVPGVGAVETRISGIGLLDVPGVADPVSARLVSLPADRRPFVNDVLLRSGRYPNPARDNEVLLNEAFAEANRLLPGGTLGAVIYGRKRELVITGIASSPEFVFAVAPGAFLPEPDRFGVVWMGREALGRAFDLDGAFNDVAVRLAPGADAKATLAGIDALLARYGGRGGYGRDRMLSAQFLADELTTLATMAAILPPIFMLVAVFLLNVSLSRLVATERSNIGLLKSFGYADAAIATHYAKFSLAFALLGTLTGILIGNQVGDYLAAIYAKVYRIPELRYDATLSVYLGATGVALVAAVAGAFQAVVRAVRLPPAAALLPPAPTGYSRLGGLIERAARSLDGKTRMVARRIARFPRRSATTVIGIALALGLLITSQHFPLSMNRIVDVTFGLAQRMDATLTFAETADESILADVRRLPGVLRVEPLRGSEVVLSNGSHRQRETLLGLTPDSSFYRVLDQNLAAVAPRGDGITLPESLARKLAVGPGDRIRVEATDGHRATLELPVIAIVKPYLGGPAFMDLDALGKALREPGRLSGAYVGLDSRYRDRFSARVKELPMIASISFRENASASMRRMLQEGSGFFASMFVIFSSLMAAGVAFSAARVTLAEQERDLATLRVLGFGRREVSYVLLAEIGLLLLVALPLGALLGLLLSKWLMTQFQTEIFIFPYVTSSAAYGQSALFIIAAVIGAALVVRRGVDRLDLVGVLKSRD